MYSPSSRYRSHLRARFAGWQLAKTHRPFTATIFDPAGSILMTVERPFYFVSTSLFVRDAYKNDIGEVHMNWYLAPPCLLLRAWRQCVSVTRRG